MMSITCCFALSHDKQFVLLKCCQECHQSSDNDSLYNNYLLYLCMYICLFFNFLQTSQDPNAVQAIRSMPGNNVCADCGTPSKCHGKILLFRLVQVLDAMYIWTQFETNYLTIPDLFFKFLSKFNIGKWIFPENFLLWNHINYLVIGDF